MRIVYNQDLQQLMTKLVDRFERHDIKLSHPEYFNLKRIIIDKYNKHGYEYTYRFIKKIKM